MRSSRQMCSNWRETLGGAERSESAYRECRVLARSGKERDPTHAMHPAYLTASVCDHG